MITSKDVRVGGVYQMKGGHPIYPKSNYNCLILAEYPRYFLCNIKAHNMFATDYEFCIQKVDIDTGIVRLRRF